MTTIVIAGANLAGGRAAQTLRAEGFDGRVVLVGAEPDRPYERPPLSKGYLTGQVQEGEFFLQSPEQYAEQQIELRLGTRATELDVNARTVTLETGESLGYDKLLIATGAAPRRLNVLAAELDGIRYLRTVADARDIRERLAAAERVAVVGMGFIGSEVAASARTLGKQVVALDPAELPLQRALGPVVAGRLAWVHRERGVELRLGEGVVAFEGDGRVERIVTSSGARVDCDLAVVGIGVEPVVGWLIGSGVEVRHGVVVDEHCRTNVPDVFAAGDVAEWWHPRYGRHLHVEHFDNAGDQGAAAAKAMLGTGEPYAPLPYFWSDQYDLSIQVAGLSDGAERVIFRGTVESGSWSAFYLRDGALVAALAVNRFKDFSAARRILRQGAAVTPEQLADEELELKTLLRT